MSGIVEAHERDNRNKAELNIIQALIDTDQLKGASLGIAKQILSGDPVSKLSSKQRYVYDNEIATHFGTVCTNEYCDTQLALEDLAEAILEDELICYNCKYSSEQMLNDD